MYVTALEWEEEQEEEECVWRPKHTKVLLYLKLFVFLLHFLIKNIVSISITVTDDVTKNTPFRPAS